MEPTIRARFTSDRLAGIAELVDPLNLRLMSQSRPWFIADSSVGGLSVHFSFWVKARNCEMEFPDPGPTAENYLQPFAKRVSMIE